ncbi:18527_t:CDS:1, partial [Gigaspora margarita]
LESLDNEDFGELFDNLECRINKAYEHFVKWMTPWMHLLLSICRFGGNSGHEFARAFYYVVKQTSLLLEPTEQEIKFAEQLYNDFKVSHETFGLREELLNNPEFEEEFCQF